MNVTTKRMKEILYEKGAGNIGTWEVNSMITELLQRRNLDVKAAEPTEDQDELRRRREQADKVAYSIDYDPARREEERNTLNLAAKLQQENNTLKRDNEKLRESRDILEISICKVREALSSSLECLNVALIMKFQPDPKAADILDAVMKRYNEGK